MSQSIYIRRRIPLLAALLRAGWWISHYIKKMRYRAFVYGVGSFFLLTGAAVLVRYLYLHHGSYNGPQTVDFFVHLHDRHVSKESSVRLKSAWKSLAHAKHQLCLGRMQACGKPLERAIKIFSAYGDYNGKAHAKLTQALILIADGQLIDLKPQLYQFLHYFSDGKDAIGLCEANMALGRYYLACGDMHKATSFLERAMDIAKKESFYPYNILILLDRAHCYTLLGSIEDAKHCALEALRRAKSCHDYNMQGWSIKTLADIDFAYNLYAAAEEHYADAKALFHRVENNYGEGVALLNLGKIDIKFGRYAQANLNLEQSFTIFHKLQEPNGLLMVEYQKCKLLRHTGSYEEAVDAFQSTFNKTASRQHDNFEFTDFLLSFGELHLSVGKTSAALDVFNRGLILAQDNGLLTMECKFHFFMGKLKKRLFKFVEEREHYNRALAIAKNTGFIEYYYKTLCSIAKIERTLKNTTEAHKILDRIRKKIEGQKNYSLLGPVLCSLATVDIVLGDIPSAERYLQQSTEAQKKVPKDIEALRTLFWMGVVSTIKGDYEESLAHFDYVLTNLSLKKQERYMAKVGVAKALVLFYRGQHAEAKELFENSLLIAQKMHDQLVMGRAMYGLALIANAEGLHTLVHTHVAKALECFDSIHHYEGRADCMLLIADVKAESGCVVESIHIVNDVKSRMKDNVTKVDALNYWARFCYIMGAYHEGREIGETALAKATRLSYVRGQCIALIQLGGLTWRLGNYKEALFSFEKAEGYARKLGDPMLMGNALLGVSKVYIKKGLFGSARLSAQRALSSYHSANCVLQSIRARRLLRDIDAMQLEAIVSASFLQGDLDFCEAQQLLIEKANIYLSMATSFMEYDNASKARECLQKALDIFRSKKLSIREAQVFVKLAKIDMKEGGFLTAEQRIQKADTIFAEHLLNFDSQLTHIEMGTLYFAQGKMEHALQTYNEVLEHLSLEEHPYERVRISVLKGKVYEAQHKIAEARACYMSAYATFKQMEDSLSCAYTLCDLANLEKKEGNLRHAIGTYGKALRIAAFLNHTKLVSLIKSKMAKLNYAIAPLRGGL